MARPIALPAGHVIHTDRAVPLLSADDPAASAGERHSFATCLPFASECAMAVRAPDGVNPDGIPFSRHVSLALIKQENLIRLYVLVLLWGKEKTKRGGNRVEPRIKPCQAHHE